jgi:hypothetical protein
LSFLLAHHKPPPHNPLVTIDQKAWHPGGPLTKLQHRDQVMGMTNVLFISLLNLICLTAFASPVPEGSWHKPCENILGDEITTQLQVKGSSWHWTHQAFENEGCKIPYLRFERKFQASLEIPNLNLKLINASYTPLSKEVANAFNQIEFCGLRNWKKDVTRSIVGKICEGVQNYIQEQMTYSKFSITFIGPRELLWIGEPTPDFDGTTPEKRHVSFELYAYER